MQKKPIYFTFQTTVGDSREPFAGDPLRAVEWAKTRLRDMKAEGWLALVKIEW